MRYLPFILLLALTIYALVDCVRNDDAGLPVALPKGVWVILIVLFPGIGPIAWLVVSRAGRQAGREGSTAYSTSTPPPSYRPPRRPSRPVRMRPVAPDDDPEFLASLNNPRPPSGDVPDENSSASEPPTPEPPAPEPPSPADDDSTEQGDDGHDSDPRPNPGPDAHS